MAILLDGNDGEIFPSWNTGTRPASPQAGQTGYNATLNTLETYNGAKWIQVPSYNVPAPSTSGNVMLSDGTNWTSSAKQLTSMTPVTLSGSSQVLTTTIPSWVKRITLLFNGVSVAAAVDWIIQIGTSSGLETTGYDYASSAASGGTLGGQAALSTNGYIIRNSQTTAGSGIYTLTLMNSSTNTWIGNGQFGANFNPNGYISSSVGIKSLAGSLTRISLLCTGSTWSTGTVSIIYE